MSEALGASELVPMLATHDAAAALGFFENAFGATVLERIEDAEGHVAHAELRIGRVRFMLADEYPGSGALAPTRLGGSPVLLLLMLDDMPAGLARALAAGATLDRPIQAQPIPNAKITDPFGHRWMLAQNEGADPSPEKQP
ncbi:MAG: VOC family protein [Armatimonadota bacterium]